MRPAAKIVNIFAAWFSNFAIRMIFESPFNEFAPPNLVPLIGNEGRITQSVQFQRMARRSTVGYPGHSTAEGLGRFEFLLIS
jgi:hypothetical protein